VFFFCLFPSSFVVHGVAATLLARSVLFDVGCQAVFRFFRSAFFVLCCMRFCGVEGMFVMMLILTLLLL